jgi:hypothetical protein
VIKEGADSTTFPLLELVTEIELGRESVVSGELVIVMSIVDVLDGRTETTWKVCQAGLTKRDAQPTFYS